MKKLIKLLIFFVQFFLYKQVFSQDLAINDSSIELFIKEIVKDKRLEYVYSRKGYLFSDFLIIAKDQKILSLYRNNGKIIPNGTPILFLNDKNIKVDSLFFNSWPPDGTPNTFSPLLEVDGALLFFPELVYPTKTNFYKLKKPTKGFIQDFQLKDKIQFKDLGTSNQLLRNYFTFDNKKRTLISKSLKSSFNLDSILYRYNDSKVAIFDKGQEIIYFLDGLNEINIMTYDVSNKGLINFEILGHESIVFSTLNKNSKKFEIRILNIKTGETKIMYESLYYIPRVKIFNNSIYFEIASKFSDSEYIESIIFKINL